MLQNIELCYFCSFMFFRSILTIHICLCSKELRYFSKIPKICRIYSTDLWTTVVPLVSVPQIFGPTWFCSTDLWCECGPTYICSTDLWSHLFELFLFHRSLVPLVSVPQICGPTCVCSTELWSVPTDLWIFLPI